jgi:PAS domain S-box-containing protein
MESVDSIQNQCSLEPTDLRRRIAALESELAALRDFRVLLENAEDGIYIRDLNGKVKFVNPKFLQIHGLKPEEILGKSSIELLSFDSEEKLRIQEQIQQAIATGTPPVLPEAKFIRADGSLGYVQVNLGFIKEDHKIRDIFGIVRDITERKQAERIIQQMSEERRALASKVMQAQETERARIARELHDVLGQTLTALKMDGAWLSRHYQNTAEVRRVSQELCAKLDGMIDLVRTLSYQLHPPILDDLDVGSALESLVHEVSKLSTVVWKTRIEFLSETISSEVATGCYRIAQEAMTNVVRHARARSASLSLRQTPRALILTIADDGKGIPQSGFGA